jgi:hypothetical protein
MKLKLPAFMLVIKNSVLDWWDAWIDFEVISMFWLLAQVTVIFGPPVTFGVYYAINVLIRTGENIGIKGVLQGTKQYFWRGLGWGALNWAVLLIGAVNINFYGNMNTNLGFIARMIVTVVLAGWIITQYFALPFFMAQEEEKIFLAIRNGFFVALASPLFSLGILLTVALLLASCGLLIIPTFFGVPVLLMILGTRALYNRLEVFGVRKKDVDPREVR